MSHESSLGVEESTEPFPAGTLAKLISICAQLEKQLLKPTWCQMREFLLLTSQVMECSQTMLMVLARGFCETNQSKFLSQRAVLWLTGRRKLEWCH